MFGLRVNLTKSLIIPIGELPNVNVLAHFFGCRVEYLPAYYLGLPLGASYKCKVVWDPDVSSSIRDFHPSRGERLTFLKSTLWSLPIYLMSLFTIPVSTPN